MISNLRTYFVLVSILLFGLVDLADASTTAATFESFYQKGWDPNWILIAAGAILALGLLVLFPPGVPAGAAVVGSAIGGWFGLSGAAATKFGLALLGGGAVASGGLGIAGGVAVLGSALFFTTDTVLDYSVNRVNESYQYEKFAAASRHMTTLPAPRNDKGSKRFRDAASALRKLQPDEPFSSETNRRILDDAIANMHESRAPRRGGKQVRDDTLRALLHFQKDDYRSAIPYAERAYRWGIDEGLIASLPAYLLAVTSLSEDHPDINAVLRALEYSVLAEPDHGLKPLMFSVFLDRLIYRMNDGAASAIHLRRVADIALERDPGQQTAAVLTVVMARYLLRLFAEQQKIQSLSTVCVPEIRNSGETLHAVQAALGEYRILLRDGHFVAGAMRALSKEASRDKALLKETEKLLDSLQKYSNDEDRLRAMIRDLEHYQVTNSAAGLEGSEDHVYFVELPEWIVSVVAYNQWGEEIRRGSGFFLDQDGLFVTLLQNISGASRLAIEMASGEITDTVYELGRFPDLDLALLRIDTSKSKVLPTISGTSVSVGDSVHVLWAPGDSLRSCSHGRVVSFQKTNRAEYLKISAPIFPGFSGSPVMNDAGEVIGLAVEANLGKTLTEVVLPVSDLHRALQRPLQLKGFRGPLIRPEKVNTIDPPEWWQRRPKIDPDTGAIGVRQALAQLAEFEKRGSKLRLSHEAVGRAQLPEGDSVLLSVSGLDSERYTIVAACDEQCHRIALFIHGVNDEIVLEATDEFKVPSIEVQGEDGMDLQVRARMLECFAEHCSIALAVFRGAVAD